jgi:feruloyl-CoA synthase
MSEPTRAVKLGRPPVKFASRPDGTMLVGSPQQVGAYPRSLTERLEHWAREAPERVFIAERDASDAWRGITYAETLAHVRALGQALLDRKLSAERPVLILSGNDIQHALLGLACLHVGVPYAPISVPYSTVSSDFARLRHIVDLLEPGLIFAADGAAFGRAIAAVVSDDVEVVLGKGKLALRAHTDFAALLATVPTPAVEAAAAAIGPDTVAKFLFTSGSTGLPKGVINTQRMLCCNQQQILEALLFMGDTPPVIVDWLPWNHTFGGNHNVGLVLYNGGSFYIDDGQPTPSGIARTVRNLREIAPTVYFNVPKGYEELVAYLRAEPELRRLFFSRLELMFYAGAGLAQHVWDELNELAIATTGQKVVMLTGLGSTETAPFAICCRPEVTGSGIVGLPVPGVTLKLVPDGDKLEARVRGPNVTPGYWRDEKQTLAAYDDEGFYKFGDALKFVDSGDLEKGFRFDGRISEDFKLATGTWVHVGALRARIVAALAPYARDAVVAGHDQDYVSVLVVPDPAACVGMDSEALLAAIQPMLVELAASSTGSSTRVARAGLLEGPLSLDAGEITDKGSLNQRAVLKARAHLVADLYAEPPPPSVFVVPRKAREKV